jgi:hypothetical protein
MEYIRKIDLDALPYDRRANEPLVDRESGVAGMSVALVVTPPGEGSPGASGDQRSAP